MIPRILHFVWGGGPRPAWVDRNLAEWRRLNPDFQIHVHGAEVCLPELRPAFDAAASWSSKSDPLRYSALARFGGWYFDVDFWPLRPLAAAYDSWDLRPDRLFVSRQQGHRSGDRLPYAATPLACGPESPAIRHVVRACAATSADSRIAFGPDLIKRLVDADPHLFEVAEAGWFFPIAIDDAGAAYDHLRAGLAHRLNLRNQGTAGALPFAAHLWAEAVNLTAADHRVADPSPVAIVQTGGRPDHPLDAIATGLQASGYTVRRAATGEDLATGLLRPDLLVCWNGRRDLTWRAASRRLGIPALYLEHGFWQRQAYTQVDHEGFLHQASWRRNLGAAAPEGSAARLTRFLGGADLVPMAPRSTGHVLVLGQVAGDTQMQDSEIEGPVPLLKALDRGLPAGLRAFFRPHPQTGSQARLRIFRRVPELPPDPDERTAYARTKGGPGLAKALESARFCVAINTNALNEALAAGIPCLAFGPMLGIDAGAVRRTTLATLTRDLQAMADGWCPDSATVARYLQHLAARQYARNELADPAVLAPLLAAAGAPTTAAQAVA